MFIPLRDFPALPTHLLSSETHLKGVYQYLPVSATNIKKDISKVALFNNEIEQTRK